MNNARRTALPRAFFLPTDAGQRFCLFHPPQGGITRGDVLYLHPFAEELNSTRRIVAQQSRALAQAGYGVLQIDLLGCGDSEGDFADATWAAWLNDAQQAHRWLREHSSGPLWLWGMRAGALLAAALANALPGPSNLLLWQPAVDGQQMLQQFLRLHTATQWLDAGKKGEVSAAHMLASGQSVDIAGYTLSPLLAQDLGTVRLLPPPIPTPGQLVWLELSTQAAPVLSPASEKQIASWQDVGWKVHAKALNGPLFWQTVAACEAPALVQATLEALTGTVAGPAMP